MRATVEPYSILREEHNKEDFDTKLQARLDESVVVQGECLQKGACVLVDVRCVDLCEYKAKGSAHGVGSLAVRTAELTSKSTESSAVTPATKLRFVFYGAMPCSAEAYCSDAARLRQISHASQLLLQPGDELLVRCANGAVFGTLVGFGSASRRKASAALAECLRVLSDMEAPASADGTHAACEREDWLRVCECVRHAFACSALGGPQLQAAMETVSNSPDLRERVWRRALRLQERMWTVPTRDLYISHRDGLVGVVARLLCALDECIEDRVARLCARVWIVLSREATHFPQTPQLRGPPHVLQAERSALALIVRTLSEVARSRSKASGDWFQVRNQRVDVHADVVLFARGCSLLRRSATGAALRDGDAPPRFRAADLQSDLLSASLARGTQPQHPQMDCGRCTGCLNVGKDGGSGNKRKRCALHSASKARQSESVQVDNEADRLTLAFCKEITRRAKCAVGGDGCEGDVLLWNSSLLEALNSMIDGEDYDRWGRQLVEASEEVWYFVTHNVRNAEFLRKDEMSAFTKEFFNDAITVVYGKRMKREKESAVVL